MAKREARSPTFKISSRFAARKRHSYRHSDVIYGLDVLGTEVVRAGALDPDSVNIISRLFQRKERQLIVLRTFARLPAVKRIRL